jgi:preprotein translocase subunit YajC
VSGSILLFIVVLFGAIYVFMIMPQRKARRAQQDLITKLTPGAEVVTTGGLYGTITEVEDGDTILLEVAEDTEVRVAKASVVRAIPQPSADEPVDDGDDAGTDDDVSDH